MKIYYSSNTDDSQNVAHSGPKYESSLGKYCQKHNFDYHNAFCKVYKAHLQSWQVFIWNKHLPFVENQSKKIHKKKNWLKKISDCKNWGIQILLYVWCPSGYIFFWKKSKLRLKYAKTLGLVQIIKGNLKRFLNLFIGRLLATCMYTKHFLINLVLTILACKCWLQILSYSLWLGWLQWLILKVHAYLCKICCTFKQITYYVLSPLGLAFSLFYQFIWLLVEFHERLKLNCLCTSLRDFMMSCRSLKFGNIFV